MRRKRKNTRVWIIIPVGDRSELQGLHPVQHPVKLDYTFNFLPDHSEKLVKKKKKVSSTKINYTNTDVSSCEAGVSHPADQCRSGSSNISLAIVNIIDISSVQSLQV